MFFFLTLFFIYFPSNFFIMFGKFIFLIFVLGDFRKLKVERADTEEDIEKNGGFLTPTKFEHHNFTAMEKFV